MSVLLHSYTSLFLALFTLYSSDSSFTRFLLGLIVNYFVGIGSKLRNSTFDNTYFLFTIESCQSGC